MQMNRSLALLLLVFGHALNGQAQTAAAIDNTNYYKYSNVRSNLNWIRACDAVPIIIDELIKDNIAYHTISVGDLTKINDSTRFVITVAFKKGDKKYGFIYEATHGLPLDPKDRDFLTDRKKAYYIQAEEKDYDHMNFMRIDPLPNNIFLLKQTCYWFQFDANGTKYPVSKEIAKSILQQDIRDYLKNL
jgi:hypothetical protein